MAVQDVDEFRLAAWYGCQRVLCKKGELSIERKKLLEKNGVNLEPNDKEQEWHTKLSNYLDFKAKHGREPKATLKDADERILAQWRNNLTRPNMIGQLSPEKRKLLEENGVNLEPKDNDKKWHAHLADYLEFEAKNGRPPSAWTKDPDELRLAQWRASQTKNNSRGVPAERKKILEEKGLLAPRQRGRRMNQDQEADSA
ncbi:MAG: hypothetical protein NT051_04625 [Candidatus Micrarchaeota archaeon]|nr:hypothetical protein [Candidatus Micrarchaeota archaeon]